MIKKSKNTFAIIASIIALTSITGCSFRFPSFLERCVTTDDGFVYYNHETKGLCIIEIPQVEDVVIPKYIDGFLVGQLGYQQREMYMGSGDYLVDGNRARKLTIQNRMNYYGFNFDNVETLTVINPATSLNLKMNNQLIIDNRLRSSNEYSFHELPGLKEIILEAKETEELEVAEGPIDEILISNLVTTIEVGVFANLENAVIKTSHESKPEGWAEGWNGSCQVEWGVDVNVEY